MLGLASVYSGLGLVAGLTGTMFGTVSSNPWLLFLMGNLLLLMALIMFNVIPLTLPAGLGGARSEYRERRAVRWGICDGSIFRTRGGALRGAGVPGGPDVGNDDAERGVRFRVSLCVLAGYECVAGGGRDLVRVPVAQNARAGMWMLWAKRLFGVVMIGVAEYYFIKAGQVWF